MPHRTNPLVLLGALLWACGTPQPEQPQDVTSDLRVLNEKFTTAFAQHDAQAVAELYSADAKVLPPNGDVVSGRAAIETFWQGAMNAGFASVALTIDEAVGLGDMAHELGRYVLSGADGQTIDEGKYIVIWKRTQEGWRLHRDIWNSSRATPLD